MKERKGFFKDQDNRDIIPTEDDMRLIWENFKTIKDKYPKPDLNTVWDDVNSKLNWRKKGNIISINKKIARIAATFIFSILLIGFGVYYSVNKFSNKVQYITYNAPDGLRSNIKLPDGSIVWLQPKSQIKYPKVFSSTNREILFYGKGYFNIIKDPKKPFIVHVNNVDVSVLGTQFYINANLDNDIVETGLISGKVKISNKSIEKYLIPNDVALFSRSKNEIVDIRDLNSFNYRWENSNLVFDNCSFGKALKEISELYQLQLEINSTIDLDRRVTLTIRDESIEEIMEILKIIVPFEYLIKEDKLIITSRE